MSRTYKNPVQRGFFPDPSVVRVGEDYYMVNSSFQYFPAIPISHSKDMVHWKIIGHAVTNSDYLYLSEISNSHGIWAPDISYHDGKFYIFATLRLNGALTGEGVLRRQLMVTSEKPEGPYSKPVWLEADNIDPSHFIDDDGTHYMITAPGATAYKLSSDCTKIIDGPKTIWAGTGERCPEGPHILKKDGWYYAIVAEGGTGYGHGINVARSRELFGEYEECPYNPVMRQKDPNAQIQRAGHGKLIETQNGEWWAYYLCGRRNNGNYTTVGRETALDPVTWTKDGWFLINDGKGPSEENVAPNLEVYAVENDKSDNFDGELKPFWEFVRNPEKSAISLDERKGFLRLYTTDNTIDEINAKNILLRRETELKYSLETKLCFNPTRNGEQAGIVCYYSNVTYARFALCYNDGLKFQIAINRNKGEELCYSIPAKKSGFVHLKVCVDGLTRKFYYSYDGEEYHHAGTLNNCIYLCDEGVPEDRKRHTGTLVGIYSSNGGCRSRIPADFDYVKYED